MVYPYNAATAAPGKALVNVASAVQTQTGDDNLAHIAGANYPVCGKAKAVAAPIPHGLFAPVMIATLSFNP